MIAVRPATPDDAELLALLHERTWRETYWGALPDRAALAESRGPDYWRALTRRLARDAAARDQAVYIAREAGRPVGFAWSGAARGSDAPWEGEIYMLYVLDAYHRRGAGRGLMAASARHLFRRGFFRLGLWCVTDNGPGRAFYEALGGARVATARQLVGGAPVDVVGYVWADDDRLARRLD